MQRWPKIPLGLRLFLLYFVIVIMTTYFVSSTLLKEIKPTVRQTTEETLVDMANLLAVLVADDLANETLQSSKIAHLIQQFGNRSVDAAIWGVDKKSMTHRIYVTDMSGIVVADSWQQDIGRDFSRWNDVYLTLRGQYGARSTATDPNDPLSTVMHVAAPVIYQGQTIGSLTVAKANRSVQPFIDLSKQRVINWLAVMSVLVLLVGAVIAWRINSALKKLSVYAYKMGRGEKATKPVFRVFYEYGQLSDALADMRNQLDGKNYVESYVETLTHELKSPLSGIKGASELLQMPLEEDKRHRFATNIERESERMQSLIDKLLVLAKLEKQPELEQTSDINSADLVHYVADTLNIKMEQKAVKYQFDGTLSIAIVGDIFLLRQALLNLFDNALDFVTQGGALEVHIVQRDEHCCFVIFNEGAPIPDYALARLTERFYSLPRANGNKSTGLGLNFVEQVAKLHFGYLQIRNRNKGVEVTLAVKTP
ncbi:two-component system sensor histidine kinase CreC [Pseudoalteromonas sp. Of7M-16]|uniref:two-component system sensor histidine kinase CreC n=1 Tax=Pseudoalteromonas sp. Of7M-16 TaxID=2917756 RepID=UPI001EF6B91D|nr:two-component system sensor histidine kinase CreC [Pseudoalteromonas sp. Of7M-16]MCG7548117.1 two-component system sensor histidine kinase CreC [Pseudoalteromonas sp. Of7M-16]